MHTSSFRTVRGYTLAAVIADEVAFWRSEDGSANPDSEVIAALRPGLLTSKGLLLVISTPYSRRGILWDAYKAHMGVNGDPVLFWQGSSLSMHSDLDTAIIAKAYEDDPQAAAAEYGGEFRTDLEAFISEELLRQAVVADRIELPPSRSHVAFVDPSGGSQDSFTLGIAHGERETVVLDLVREVVPPFSPEDVVRSFAEECTRYGVTRVTGDHYAGEFPRELFRKHGITYTVSEQTKSEIYLTALPMLTSGRVELLDHKRLVSQLRGLERRTGRSGKDSVDHGPRGRDDVANAALGALVSVKRAESHWGFLPATAHTESTAERAAKFLGSQPRTNDQIHPHERIEPVGRPEMSTRKAMAWEKQPDLPDSTEKSLQCADPRCGIRWTAHPTDVEASFERHWRDVGGKHTGRPLPPVGQRYVFIEPRAKPAPAPRMPDLPKVDGWTLTADPLNQDRVVYMCDECKANGNLLRLGLEDFIARHMKDRHA